VSEKVVFADDRKVRIFSNTIRTARVRTSGEYFIDLVAIAPSSQGLEPPANPMGWMPPPGGIVMCHGGCADDHQ
jgi:hypothetical protein